MKQEKIELEQLLDGAPRNNLIVDSIIITHNKLSRYKKVMCSISGGSDSDILLDLLQKFSDSEKVTYVFFDTGIEFKATREHIEFLEKKYGIEIKKIRAVKPIPTCCKEFGQPFLSKNVSERMERLQRHGFKWEDEPLDVLLERYPRCRSALRWWCNDFSNSTGGESSFNISYNRYLKEFILNNPPQFSISNKCCHYAKKLVASRFKKSEDFDLNIFGVRKAEGGARKNAYKTCFNEGEDGIDDYRPIFWYLADTKIDYEDHYGVIHSRCYTEYGLKRTGCAGCPYGRDLNEELRAMESYEPNLFKAVNNVFKDSYAYTAQYREFVKRMKEKKDGYQQLSLFDEK